MAWDVDIGCVIVTFLDMFPEMRDISMKVYFGKMLTER